MRVVFKKKLFHIEVNSIILFFQIRDLHRGRADKRVRAAAAFRQASLVGHAAARLDAERGPLQARRHIYHHGDVHQVPLLPCHCSGFFRGASTSLCARY